MDLMDKQRKLFTVTASLKLIVSRRLTITIQDLYLFNSTDDQDGGRKTAVTACCFIETPAVVEKICKFDYLISDEVFPSHTNSSFKLPNQ